SVVGGRVLHRVGVRRMVVAGVFLLTVGFLLLTRIGAGTPLAFLMADMGLVGTGMGLVVLAAVISVPASVTKERLGVAEALFVFARSFWMFARSIGGAIGVASMGALLASQLATGLAALQGPARNVDPNALLNPVTRTAFPPETLAALETVLSEALRGVFWIGSV